ncbi:uncharacterized protein LOC142981838 [Anticarsia gemmatalis]|uniref:uncharacterized protein LOC142981838 n=1 Tax=Anticarsia gemmatalis TaxID=129554 RepID=UPI003F769EEB
MTMAPQTLNGETLGEKHRHFNKLVQDAVTNEQFQLSQINSEHGDIHNLLNIDIACRTRNVQYIIEVLKCDDMLYVSRAIKRSTWLITEQTHAHIINPEYLYTQLFPHMHTKAINKLLLHIRLHLKDERRIEAFYDYLKDDRPKEAAKWLLTCSIPFTEKVLKNTRNITLKLFKRLCKRSIIFMPYYTKVTGHGDKSTLEAVIFLIKSHTKDSLDVFDACKRYCIPRFGRRHTKNIMKSNPNRILDNFDKYVYSVDMPTVAKYMKKSEIKDFLMKYGKTDYTNFILGDYLNLRYFLDNIPVEERFKFVEKIYIDKNRVGNESEYPLCDVSVYHWYNHAPFDIAFVEMKGLIRVESSPGVRCDMLSVLISIAKTQPQHVKTLLRYYYDKHRNEQTKYKIQFLNNIITKIVTRELDLEIWNILEELFQAIRLYSQTKHDVQIILLSIIIYKVCHDEEVPIVVEEKLEIKSFVKFLSLFHFSDKQQNKVNHYLINYVSSKMQNKPITTETDFCEVIQLLKIALNLLRRCKMPAIVEFYHNKIREFLKIREDNSWDVCLSSLYNMNKLCRRYLFEESIMLCPNEEVCLNVLKHKPQLLATSSKEIDALRTNNVSLRRLLAKIRIYWSNSLAHQWTDAYLKNLNNICGHKALIKGLFVLLPQQQLINIAKEYVSKISTTHCNDINQKRFQISKNIGSYLHLARPLAPLDIVLWYAISDCKQDTIPSLNSILYNLSEVQCRDNMEKLLKGPVSVQIQLLRFASNKLTAEENKSIILDVCNSTQNVKIQTHLICITHSLLCKVKDPNVLRELWDMFKMFIDNLPPRKNQKVFSKLCEVKNIHINIRGEFYMKSYEYLSSLPAKMNSDSHVNTLLDFAPDLMGLLDADFVADKILTPVEEKISEEPNLYVKILTSFILHGKTENNQCERFRRVLAPVLENAFKVQYKEEKFVEDNIATVLTDLARHCFTFICLKRIVVPVKLFTEIKRLMEEKLSIEANYILYTSWRITSEYVKLVAEYQDMLSDPRMNLLSLSDFDYEEVSPDDVITTWAPVHTNISKRLGPTIVQYLKEDTEKYFPISCSLFIDALKYTFQNQLYFITAFMDMEVLKYMIVDQDYIPSYIVVCYATLKYGGDDTDIINLQKEIETILLAHPSKEVYFHYAGAFGDQSRLIL